MTDNRQIVAQAWATHRQLFRAETTEAGQFVVTDGCVTPPMAWVCDAPEGRPRVVEVDLPRLGLDAGTVAKTALRGGFSARELEFQQASRMLGALEGGEDFAALSIRRFLEDLPDVRLAAIVPAPALLAAEQQRFAGAGLAAYFEQVNKEALVTLRYAEDVQPNDYAFYAAPGEQGHVRRQAGTVYPLMATLFPRRFSLVNAIDRMAPLADAVEAAFTPLPEKGQEAATPVISKAAFNRLRGVTFPARGLTPEFISRVVTALPPDWFPKKAADLRREDWDAFTDLAGPAATILGPLTGTPLPVLFENCGGKWEAFRDRVVRGFTDSRTPHGVPDNVVETMKAEIPWQEIRALPRDKIPAAAAEAVDRMATPLEGHNEDGTTWRTTPDMIADWIVRLEAPANSRHAIQTAFQEAEGIAAAFSHKVLMPLAMNTIGHRTPHVAYRHFEEGKALAGRILFGGKSAVAIAEAVREFRPLATAIMAAGQPGDHDQKMKEMQATAAMNDAIRSLGIDPDAPPGPNDWPPLTAMVQAPNGLWCVPLTSDELVKQEGMGPTYGHAPRENPDGSLGLNFCLGGDTIRPSFVNACRTQGRHLISFRKAADPSAGRPIFERVATIYLHEVKVGMPKFNHGYFNSVNDTQPTDEARRAFEWYQRAVLTAEIPMNHELIAANMLGAAQRMDQLEVVCGYDWRNQDTIKAAMRPWGKFVPKKVRNLGFEGFAVSPEMKALIEKIEPGTHRRLAREAQEAEPAGMRR